MGNLFEAERKKFKAQNNISSEDGGASDSKDPSVGDNKDDFLADSEDGGDGKPAKYPYVQASESPLADLPEADDVDDHSVATDVSEAELFSGTFTGRKLYRFCASDFEYTEPERVATEREVLDRVTESGHFEEQQLATANMGPHNLPFEIDLNELANKLPQVRCTLGICAIKVYRNLTILNRRPICYKKNAKETKGVYIAYLEQLKQYKFGMSAWLCTRMQELHSEFGLLYAALVFTVEEIEELLGPEINAIMALKHPGIRPTERDLVALQLGEAALACVFKTCTRTIAERLVQVPSQLVLNVFQEETFLDTVLEIETKMDKIHSNAQCLVATLVGIFEVPLGFG